jgi:hypothetical protein
MDNPTKEQIEYENSLELLRLKLNDMIDEAQVNAEKLQIQLQSTRNLLDDIKNYKPSGFKITESF